MGMNNIGMDYASLTNDANDLETKISSYNSNCTEFFKIVDNMRSYWEGSAANAAINAILNYKPEFTNLGETLIGYPATIKNAVNL